MAFFHVFPSFLPISMLNPQFLLTAIAALSLVRQFFLLILHACMQHSIDEKERLLRRRNMRKEHCQFRPSLKSKKESSNRWRRRDTKISFAFDRNLKVFLFPKQRLRQFFLKIAHVIQCRKIFLNQDIVSFIFLKGPRVKRREGKAVFQLLVFLARGQQKKGRTGVRRAQGAKAPLRTKEEESHNTWSSSKWRSKFIGNRVNKSKNRSEKTSLATGQHFSWASVDM